MSEPLVGVPKYRPQVTTIEIGREPERHSAARDELTYHGVDSWIDRNVKFALVPDPDSKGASIQLLVFSCGNWHGDGFKRQNKYCKYVQDLLEFPHWPLYDTAVELYHYPPRAETRFMHDNVAQDHYKYGFHNRGLFAQWVYLAQTRTTIGFITVWHDKAFWWLSAFVERINLAPPDLCHPHALGLWLCSITLKKIRESVTSDSENIIKAQLQMGWHRYTKDVPPWLDVPAVDYSETVSKVVSSATLLAGWKERAAGLAEVAANMLDENSEIPTEAGQSQYQSDRIFIRYDRELKMLRSRSRAIERKCDEFLTIASIAMQGLFNLIARNDQRINTELAKDSKRIAEVSQKVGADTKRDSTSMKSIAAVTMIFLPGTFTASLFATPFFNASTVVTSLDAFWVYWAITIPLTLLTVVAWLLWVWYTQRLERRSQPSSSTSPLPSAHFNNPALSRNPTAVPLHTPSSPSPVQTSLEVSSQETIETIPSINDSLNSFLPPGRARTPSQDPGVEEIAQSHPIVPPASMQPLLQSQTMPNLSV